MAFNIKNILQKQSIIQLTLLKVILSIFAFLLLFIIFYGRNFWEKQALKLNYDLLLSASNIQTKIQSQILTIDDLKKDINLTEDDRKLKLQDKIQLMLNIDTNYIIGYYDNEFDLAVKNQYYDNISYAEICSGELSINDPYNISNNQLIRVILPIYAQEKTVGYVWAYAKNVDLVLMSFYELSAIVILALTLSVLIIISIRKHMKQIELHLDKFCKMIIDNDCQSKPSLIKLPELQPVLSKLCFYTERLKQANHDLEISKDKTTKIMEGISDGFYALGRNWEFTFVNYKLQNIINEKHTELLGKVIWEVFPEVINSLTYEKMHEAMSLNESVHWEAGGLASPDQNHEFHAYPYREGLTVFFRDITELKRQQQEISRLERLNLIGQLAAGISHEIRNPLTSVKGFLQLFASKPQYEKDKEYLDLMISEINRANTIITDFLSLAKANSDNIISQNINEVINKVLPMLQADAYNNNKEVIVDLNILPDIMINENEIKQLILNLVRNGLEATAEHGRVFISTFLRGDKVVLAIKDQGNGIPQEIQENMGTPFFTTKDSGTGLGLAISAGIAQRHGAVFKFKTGIQGTVFYTIFST